MPEQVAIVDSLIAPEIFAGGRLVYAIIGNTSVDVTVTSPRWNPEDGTAAHHVVACVVLPLHKAQELVLGLNSFLEEHEHAPIRAATHGLNKQ